MSGVRSYNFISSILERLRTHHTQNLFDTRSASDARQRLDIMRGKSSLIILQNRVPRSLKSTFFSIFSKKNCQTFGGFGKRSYLCTRFREATGVKSSDAFLCSLFETRNSIFDRLRTEYKTSSAQHIIYIIYGCCAQATKSFLLYEET